MDEELYMDVHVLTCPRVQRLIRNTIALLQGTATIYVIHGYSHGHAIKERLRNTQLSRRTYQTKKLYRYNGEIYNAVTFLCMKLLEGYRPEKKKMNSLAKIAARMDSIRRTAAIPLTCMGSFLV